MGLMQGVTELFPISSLGHSVILPGLLGWDINSNGSEFLIFLVATHFATALVLFLFFLKDWVRIIKGFFTSIAEREIRGADAKLFWLLVVGTIPAGILGLLFEDQFKLLFSSPKIVAVFLTINGLLLFGGDWLRKHKAETTESGSDERISKLSWVQSVKVGTTQALALFPGFSRTGAAMTGSLLQGLSHEDSARFAFLLATPIIGAAALLKLPELLVPENAGMVIPSLVGAVCAGVAAFLSVKFLTKYFETKSLKPFAVYCLLAGLLSGVIFFLR